MPVISGQLSWAPVFSGVIWILRIGGGVPGFGLACWCFGNYVFALNFVGKPMSLRTFFCLVPCMLLRALESLLVCCRG